MYEKCTRNVSKIGSVTENYNNYFQFQTLHRSLRQHFECTHLYIIIIRFFFAQFSGMGRFFLFGGKYRDNQTINTVPIRVIHQRYTVAATAGRPPAYRIENRQNFIQINCNQGKPLRKILCALFCPSPLQKTGCKTIFIYNPCVTSHNW